MIPRNQHVGTNSTQLDASFGDPAAIVLAADIRIATFIENLRQPWWGDASCRGVGVDDFYAGDRASISRAMTRCGLCPSRVPCLEEAVLDPRLDFGIRGGADVPARKNMRRLRRTQPPTNNHHPGEAP